MCIYNPGHILELYNILVQIRFTKSKRKLDIWYSKLGIRLASQVVEQLKTLDFRKYQKNIKFGWTHGLVVRLPSRTQTLRITVKKHTKTDTKLFFSCPVLLDYSILFQIFCPGLQWKLFHITLKQYQQNDYND